MTPLLNEVIKAISKFRHENRGVQPVIYLDTNFMGRLLKEQHDNGDPQGITHYIRSERTIHGYSVYEVFDDRHPPFNVTTG